MYVQLSTLDAQLCAFASHAEASKLSPFALAMLDAQTRPAISVAIVEGEYPLFSSQRSCPV